MVDAAVSRGWSSLLRSMTNCHQSGLRLLKCYGIYGAIMWVEHPKAGKLCFGELRVALGRTSTLVVCHEPAVICIKEWDGRTICLCRDHASQMVEAVQELMAGTAGREPVRMLIDRTHNNVNAEE